MSTIRGLNTMVSNLVNGVMEDAKSYSLHKSNMHVHDLLSGPELVDRRGSLYLKSNHMQYGTGTLNSDWHAATESHPKDYDVTKVPTSERNLLKGTYKRIGNGESGTYKSTTHHTLERTQLLKSEFAAMDAPRAHVIS